MKYCTMLPWFENVTQTYKGSLQIGMYWQNSAKWKYQCQKAKHSICNLVKGNNY